MSTKNMAVLSDVTSLPNVVQWQPPYGSRLVSGFLVNTDAIILFLITRASKQKRLLHTLSLQTILGTYTFRYTDFLNL